MAVTFNNAGTATQQTGTSFSASFSVTAGSSNKCAFAVVGYDAGSNGSALTITAITYGGQTMTSCGAAASVTGSAGGLAYMQVFFLAAPATGSNTLAITGSTDTAEIYANLVSFNGVNQTTPVRSGTYQALNKTSATTQTMTITSATTDFTLSGIMNAGGSGAVSSSNQTSDGINSNGNYSFGSDHCTTPAASITDTWTFSAAGVAPFVGFSIQPPSSFSPDEDFWEPLRPLPMDLSISVWGRSCL